MELLRQEKTCGVLPFTFSHCATFSNLGGARSDLARIFRLKADFTILPSYRKIPAREKPYPSIF